MAAFVIAVTVSVTLLLTWKRGGSAMTKYNQTSSYYYRGSRSAAAPASPTTAAAAAAPAPFYDDRGALSELVR